MAAGIELEMTVTDKGTAEVKAITQKALSSFDSLRNHAISVSHSIGNAFSGAMSKLKEFGSMVFSLRGLMVALSGAGGILLVSRAVEIIGERSETLKQRFDAVKEAAGGFIDRLIDYVGKSPELLSFLDRMKEKIIDWTQRMPELEGTIRGFFDGVSAFMQEALPKITAFVSNFLGVMKELYDRIKSMWQTIKDIAAGAKSVMSALGRSIPSEMYGPDGQILQPEPAPGTSSSPAPAPAYGSEAYWQQQVSSPITVNFNGQMSRSDVTNIISEMERRGDRGGGGEYVYGVASY
jgi:hypothetical protein